MPTTSAIKEFRLAAMNARYSSLFIGLLSNSSSLTIDSTTTQIVAKELPNQSGYQRVPVALGTPSWNPIGNRFEATLTAILTPTGSLTYDGVFLLAGGNSTIGNSTGLIATLYKEDAPILIPANKAFSFSVAISG